MALLHSVFSAEPGPPRAALYRQTAAEVALHGWADFVFNEDWPLFEVLHVHSRLLARERGDAFAGMEPLPVHCDGGLEGWGQEALADRALLALAVDVAEGRRPPGALDNSTIRGPCGPEPAPMTFRGIAECLLLALEAERSLAWRYLSVAEVSLRYCLGSASRLRLLLKGRWPFAGLLGRLHRALHPEASAQGERQAIHGELLAAKGPVHALVLGRDSTLPWIQPVAAAALPGDLHRELPWPRGAPTFEEVRAEALRLLEEEAAPAYPSPQSHRGAWRTLCLVCAGGRQDPTTRNASLGYAKTPLLQRAPALERFIRFFGRTGRVRLSVLDPGGIIGWHPDDGVVEEGRSILHVPLQTSVAALNRLGHLLLQLPQGRIHWLDYSMPHSVYNAHRADARVHLVLDVRVRGNAAFRRLLRGGLAPSARRALLGAARRGGGRRGLRLARGMASEMVRRFGAIFERQELREAYEKAIWEHVLHTLLSAQDLHHHS